MRPAHYARSFKGEVQPEEGPAQRKQINSFTVLSHCSAGTSYFNSVDDRGAPGSPPSSSWNPSANSGNRREMPALFMVCSAFVDQAHSDVVRTLTINFSNLTPKNSSINFATGLNSAFDSSSLFSSSSPPKSDTSSTLRGTISPFLRSFFRRTAKGTPR